MPVWGIGEADRRIFRRWLKLKGIRNFCGDADWVHQRWESSIYIYGFTEELKIMNIYAQAI